MPPAPRLVRLAVEQLKPQQRACGAPDQHPLREAWFHRQLRRQLALALGQKPAFRAAPVDLSADHVAPDHAALGRQWPQLARRFTRVHAPMVARNQRRDKPLLSRCLRYALSGKVIVRALTKHTNRVPVDRADARQRRSPVAGLSGGGEHENCFVRSGDCAAIGCAGERGCRHN
jgi:hypothetical protein